VSTLLCRGNHQVDHDILKKGSSSVSSRILGGAIAKILQHEKMCPASVSVQANIDMLEANKGSNKDEIRRLRAENKDVRLKLSQLVRGGAHGDEVISRNWLHILAKADGGLLKQRS